MGQIPRNGQGVRFEVAAVSPKAAHLNCPKKSFSFINGLCKIHNSVVFPFVKEHKTLTRCVKSDIIYKGMRMKKPFSAEKQ